MLTHSLENALAAHSELARHTLRYARNLPNSLIILAIEHQRQAINIYIYISILWHRIAQHRMCKYFPLNCVKASTTKTQYKHTQSETRCDDDNNNIMIICWHILAEARTQICFRVSFTLVCVARRFFFYFR